MAGINTTPATFEMERETANAFFVAGNYAVALTHFNRCVHLDSRSASTLVARALTHHKLHNYELASADCTHALALEPNNYTAFFRRGMAQKELGHLTAAKNDFSDAMLIAPGDRAAAAELALVTCQLQPSTGVSAVRTVLPVASAASSAVAASSSSSSPHQHSHSQSSSATAAATVASRFAASGRSGRLGIIGNASASNGQPHLFEPLSLQFSARENLLFVADEGRHCVEAFEVDVVFDAWALGRDRVSTRRRWAVGEAAEVPCRRPRGLALNATDRLLYACDSDNGRVIVLSATDGSVAGIIDAAAVGPAWRIDGPLTAVCVSDTLDSRLWLAGGTVAQCIDVSSAPPTVVTTLSSTFDPGSAAGIATWRGRVFVADFAKNRVAVFDEATGALRDSLGADRLQVWQPLERMEPTGIGVDRATGTLYVAGKLRCVSALSALPPFDRLHSLTGGTHDTMIDWPKGLCVDAPRGLLFVGFEAHVGVFRTLA